MLFLSPLAVKLTLAPSLIGGVSLLQRRWGPSIGGLLTGMPVMAGPVLLALAIDHDAAFAGEAAVSALQAMIAVAMFAAVYASAAVRGRLPWMASLAIAFAAYAIVMRLIIAWPFGTAMSFACVLLAQWAAVRSMPLRRGGPATRTAPPWWDIPLRMALAAALVVIVAAVAERAGARLSGLLTPFPVATTVLVVFTHQQDGAEASAGFLRGLLIGMTSLSVFFAVASVALAPLGNAGGFFWSTLASMAVSVGLWWNSRR